LWLARIHPLREARDLDEQELRALHRGIRRALELGIARQGSTLSTYALPSGESGSMQEALKVYGRDGEPCERCGMPIEKLRVAGRGTWYCPACQRSRYAATSARSSSSRPLRSRARSSV
jgi:formamidopyrimidine-DNA glycosylase